MPLAHRLIGRDPSQQASRSKEVVKHKPSVKIVLHLLDTLVSMNFGGALFDKDVSESEQSGKSRAHCESVAIG